MIGDIKSYNILLKFSPIKVDGMYIYIYIYIYEKSLVPKRSKSIFNKNKNVFSLPRKWQDENHYFLFQTST